MKAGGVKSRKMKGGRSGEADRHPFYRLLSTQPTQPDPSMISIFYDITRPVLQAVFGKERATSDTVTLRVLSCSLCGGFLQVQRVHTVLIRFRSKGGVLRPDPSPRPPSDRHPPPCTSTPSQLPRKTALLNNGLPVPVRVGRRSDGGSASPAAVVHAPSPKSVPASS